MLRSGGPCSHKQHGSPVLGVDIDKRANWPNQIFHHIFFVFECMKIAQNYAQVSLPLSHTI